MYDELVKRLRTATTLPVMNALCQEAADAIEELNACVALYKDGGETAMKVANDYKARIEELQGKADAYLDAMTYEHNRAARLLWDKEHCWIPVTERLPKYGERVLVFGGVTMYVAYYDKNRYGGESWHKLNSKSHYCNPTHWMPLPEPPKEE